MTNGRILPFLLGLAAVTLPAQPAPAPKPLWDDQLRVTLPDSVHPRLARLEPLGPVPPEMPLERMIFVLKLSPDAKARLDHLLSDQQDLTSPRYHQWLTPDQFGAQFGPAQAQLDAATGWLTAQGFTVHGAARSGLTIAFSGTAAQVGKAFRTAMVEYDVDGVRRHGNATGISIPKGLAEFAAGVVSLNDLPRTKAHVKRAAPARPALPSPQVFTSEGNAMGAGDFATIYNLNPLFAATPAPLTGTGVTLAVVMDSDVDPADHQMFVSNFGLAKYGGSFAIVHPAAAPGILPGDSEDEADVDSQWSAAAAPGADIRLVACPTTAVTFGGDMAAQYVVDNRFAAVLSASYGECESALGGAGNLFYAQLWQQAASEGISVFVSSGDSGPAGCDNPGETRATGGRAVSGVASTPYNTCVGGTMFNEGSGDYWLTAGVTSLYQTTALGYIPELPWNESGSTPGGQDLVAGGGGVSTVYAKPAWQVAPGVPSDGRRDLPDVSLDAAASHDTFLVVQGGNLLLFGGGTSFASPCMAGIMALVVQKYGWQGNPNFTLYSLGNAQYGGSGAAPAVFHDITSGNNSVPGATGWTAGPGYDLATGLGSVDANVLVANWVKAANPITVSLSTPATVTVASGRSAQFSGTATGGANLAYTWFFGDGTSAVGASASHTYLISGGANQTFQATLTASDGTYVQSAAVQVTVTPAGVSAAIVLPVTSGYVLANTAIAFSGTATTQNPGSITSYVWNFGDGGSASDSTASHAFQDGTSNTVALTATDATGATGQATITVVASVAFKMDVNGDGPVDVRDLLVIAGAWNPSLQATPSHFNGLNFFADLNGDGVVNDTDLNLWIQNFVPGVIQ
jgi:subtilase family serine protease